MKSNPDSPSPASEGSLAGSGRQRVALELLIGYALIVTTCWMPRPTQQVFYYASVAWLVWTTWRSFPGWQAMGFRMGGLIDSFWVVLLSAAAAAGAIAIAAHLHTLHRPHGLGAWILTFGGYAVWSFVQQFLMQGYFLFRLVRLLPRREWAAVAAATIFALAHLPNPILTPVTLIWGIVACFVFLRCRNVYTLAAAHAILGITVAITIPGPVIHNMRVGLGYLRYHAPRMHTGPAAAVRPSPAAFSPAGTATHSAA